MPVTHQEIAEKAGVSRALVTRALHRTRNARVSPETRLEILKVARQLGYQPRNFTTRIIAYVTKGRSLGDGISGYFVSEVEAALQSQGYRLAVATVWNDDFDFLRETLTLRNFDGVILTELFGGRIQEILSPRMPFVLTADEDNVPQEIDVVTVDTIGTLEKVTNYLLGHGHRRLCLLSVASKSSPSVYRHMEQGIRRALARAGLPQENLRVLQTGPSRGIAEGSLADQIVRGVRQTPRSTAIIAADLHRAIPAVTALCAAGLRIPQDVSFISVSDSDYFREMSPPCTATTAYGRAVAQRAAECLLHKIDAPHRMPHHERIEGEIIERQSVGRPPRL